MKASEKRGASPSKVQLSDRARHYVRLRQRGKHSLAPTIVTFVMTLVVYGVAVRYAPELSLVVAHFLMPLALLTVAAAGAGWLYFAMRYTIEVREITLEDEFGEAVTYKGKGALAWAIAGIALAFLIQLAGIAVLVCAYVGYFLGW